MEDAKSVKIKKKMDDLNSSIYQKAHCIIEKKGGR
jgi:hypothetical protein